MFSFYQNQNFSNFCPQNWFYNQPVYHQYSYSFYSPELFEWNYSIEQNQNNWPFTIDENQAATKSNKPLINYKNFDFKQQTRKINDGNGFSLISNLNSSNSLISFGDDKIRTIYDVFRKANKSSGIFKFLKII